MNKQNKGEWSELYVFLKLLGDGVLYAADAELNKKEDLYYPLIEILREENKQIKHYNSEDKVNIRIFDNTGNLLLNLPKKEFETKAKILLETIQKSDRTFSVPKIENFMNLIKCTKVKADSSDKTDITLVLHDLKTLRNDKFGFSIKSKLGGSSTLLNAGNTTNFIYEIKGNITDKQIEEINNIDTKSKIRDRLKKIQQYGCALDFYKMENKIFKANLQMIDSSFPKIMSEFLLQYYIGNTNTIKELTPIVREINPCNLDTELPHRYYEHKIKNFLIDIALGMTPAKTWDGLYQATGGYIIVREDGEILCYHIYNRNEFQEYMFNNTRFETASSGRHDFGYIYKEYNQKFFKLNLQIRFI